MMPLCTRQLYPFGTISGPHGAWRGRCPRIRRGFQYGASRALTQTDRLMRDLGPGISIPVGGDFTSTNTASPSTKEEAAFFGWLSNLAPTRRCWLASTRPRGTELDRTKLWCRRRVASRTS